MPGRLSLITNSWPLSHSASSNTSLFWLISPLKKVHVSKSCTGQPRVFMRLTWIRPQFTTFTHQSMPKGQLCPIPLSHCLTPMGCNFCCVMTTRVCTSILMARCLRILFCNGASFQPQWPILELVRSWDGETKPLKSGRWNLDIWMAFSCTKKPKSWSFYVNAMTKSSFRQPKEDHHAKFTSWRSTNPVWPIGNQLRTPPPTTNIHLEWFHEKKIIMVWKTYFYSEIIPLITYNECSFFPRWWHECDFWKYNDEFAWQKIYSILRFFKNICMWSNSSKITTTFVSNQEKNKELHEWEIWVKEEGKKIQNNHLTIIQIYVLWGAITMDLYNLQNEISDLKSGNKFTALLFCFEYLLYYNFVCKTSEWCLLLLLLSTLTYYLLNISWNFSEEKKFLSPFLLKFSSLYVFVITYFC